MTKQPRKLTHEDRAVAERHCLRWKEVLDDKARYWLRIGNGDRSARGEPDALYEMILGYVGRAEGSERIDEHLQRRHGSRTVVARRGFAKQLLDAWLRNEADIDKLLASDEADIVGFVADSLYIDSGMFIAALRSEDVRSLITAEQRKKEKVSLATAAAFLQEIGSGYGSPRTDVRDRQRFWKSIPTASRSRDKNRGPVTPKK